MDEILNEQISEQLKEIKQCLDTLGAQNDWLCENFAEFFKFLQTVGSSGGGIRGVMSMLKNGGPSTTNRPIEQTDNIEVNNA